MGCWVFRVTHCYLLGLLCYWHSLHTGEKWSSTQPIRLQLRLKKNKKKNKKTAHPSASAHQFLPEAVDKVFSSTVLNFLMLTAFDHLYFLWVLFRCQARCAAMLSAVFWARGKRTQTKSSWSATRRRAFKFFPFLKSHTSSLAGSPTGRTSPSFWE